MLYKVSWTIELDGDSPLDVAYQAQEIQRDIESTATFYEVENTETKEKETVCLG